MAFGAATHPGRVRDHNEDAHLARPPVFAVADGMGGHAAGELASRLAIESLAGTSFDDAAPAILRRALEAANSLVFTTAGGPGSTRGMGTTCVLLVIADGVAHIGNVGDSRIYRLRDGVLEQLTRDHTVVAEMVDAGLIGPDDAVLEDGRSYISRALGGAPTVDADVDKVELRDGDRFLLCSDGLSGMLSDAEIARILEAHADPQAAADALVAAANAAGGEDNITALVVDTDVATRPSRRSRGRAVLLVGVALALIILLAVVVVVLAPGAFPAAGPGSEPPLPPYGSP